MKKTDYIGLALLAFVLGCRYSVHLADFYALKCYPVISATLSLPASLLPFSLEEIVVLAFAAAFIVITVQAFRRAEPRSGRRRAARWLGRTARTAMWLTVWLYLGWAGNYFRTPLYQRIGVERAAYGEDEAAFAGFLADYTARLNADASSEAPALDKAALEADIKAFYGSVMPGYGYTALRSWQHVKRPLINPLYSAVGVLGFMGPFFCESQVNQDLKDGEYPFTLAHELAHLSGVTSEAEANYWAYTYCTRSPEPSVRYCGRLEILGYVASNARALLGAEAYESWASSLCDKALQDYDASRAYWSAKRVKAFDAAQSWMMDLFLRSNRVSEGARDYFGVVGMIMTLDNWEKPREENL